MSDPCVRASVGFVVVVAILAALRLKGLAGSRWERLVFALFLAAMPLVYIELFLRSGAGGWIWIELGGLAAYATLAFLGWRYSPWFLVIGIALHGALWDLWHYGRTPYVPNWYAVGCALVDVLMAGYAAMQVKSWNRAAKAVIRT